MTVLYLLLLLVLGIYSYSQIDLNLTLLQTPWFLSFQNTMIQLGYYHRQLSTVIFVSLIFLLFLIKPKNVFAAIAGITILGLFSYPAFSHDIFNAIFYPREILMHGANPYQVTALMFPDDTWTRFMHWTHNTYQWGPAYLALTIPFYLLGMGKFVLTLFWFKAMGVLAYLGCSYYVYRIAKTEGLILFALNPLIIIEGVISGHLDIVMLFFSLAAIHFIIKKKKTAAYIFLLFSVGIKFTTGLFFPVFVLWDKFTEKQHMWSLILLAYGGALAQVFVRDILPHYFIVPLGLSALYPKNKSLVILMVVLSFILLLVRYLPFLLTGQWLKLY